jgi:hypothetical protein
MSRLERDYYAHMAFDPEHSREVLGLYVPFFEGSGPVLELAPGRGEFLGLLREAGIAGRGVDMDEGMVEVARAGGHGVVRVRDHGVGIPPRMQRKIFRKFFRIQTDAGSGPQGTGLGLAIVDHVMRGHGGFVRVDSEPGRGSTFTLHFPLYAGESHGDQTHPGDRGRASDVARSA